MISKNTFLLLAGFAFFFVTEAHALQVSVLGGLSAGKPSYSAGSAQSKTALTYGALLGDNGMVFGFETGLLSVGKKFSSGGVEYSGRAWEIPALVRFTLLPIVSAGAGAYYQNYSDKPFIAQKSTDLGLKLNARIRLPLAPLTGFLVDLSFKRGFSDLSNGVGTSYKNQELDLLAGLNFGF
ncbi:MAG: hypothetical protein H7301_09985 [Cryobacterium sp.]|nr:hypothetical protein [Oligoflexia bacterium]